MFSKFLRRISVAVIGIIFLLGAFSGMTLCVKAQSPGIEELEVFQIEQVRAEMPQIQVYVRGVNANEACEAYLDGNALTSTGKQSLDENGTSYLIMLDISGSITSEYFLAAKKQVEELAQNLGPKDKITLITFGDTVKMQVSDSQNVDEISEILALLQAKDKKTNLYRAFDQCLKYVEAESQKERQIVLVISDGIQDTGHAGLFSTAGDMAKLAIALMEEKVLSIENLKKIGINRTGKMIGENDVTQFHGYLCYSKNPIEMNSEVNHFLSGNAFALGGYTGNQLTIDIENGVYVFFASNRCHNRVTNITGASEEDYVQNGYVKWKGGKSYKYNKKYAYDRDDCVMKPAVKLALKYKCLEYILGESTMKTEKECIVRKL